MQRYSYLRVAIVENPYINYSSCVAQHKKKNAQLCTFSRVVCVRHWQSNF